MDFHRKLGLDAIRLLIYLLVLIFSAKGEENAIAKSKSDYQESYADLMKSYMNISVRPCDDFYEYACGNYGHDSPLRWMFNGNKPKDVTKHLKGRIEHLLGRLDLAKSLNVSSELKVAQGLYNACMAADLYPFPAADPNYLRLIRSIGGFPAVDGATWNASNFSWFNMSAHLTNYGAEGLIHEMLLIYYPFEPYLNNRPLLGFDTIFSSSSYQLNTERMRCYLRSFKLPRKKIEEVIGGIIAFWREAIMVEERPEKYGNCEAFEAYYFKIAWNQDQPMGAARCNFYFVQLDEICSRHSEAVANYLALKLLYTFDAKLNAPQYQKDYCATRLQNSMPFLFNKLYMAEHFTEEIKLEVSEMVGEVRKSLQRSLRDADWLDAESRKEVPPINSPFDFTEVNLLADRLIPEISRLEIDDHSYAATNINFQRLSVDLNRFSTRHSKELPESSRSQNFLLHDVFHMATLLQAPVYHQSWPFSLKFGALGSIVARSFGNYQWEFEMGYRQHLKCFADYYEKLLDLDGNTWDVNKIADFGRLRLAFSAYQSHMKHLLEDPNHERINEQMPGLDMSPDQLFFLGSVQMLCFNFKEDGRLTAMGSLTSNEEFFQAFNCSEGSGMRPVAETCHLW